VEYIPRSKTLPLFPYVLPSIASSHPPVSYPPLVLDILEGRGGGHGEAQEEHVRLWVGQRTEPVVVFLPGRVP